MKLVIWPCRNMECHMKVRAVSHSRRCEFPPVTAARSKRQNVWYSSTHQKSKTGVLAHLRDISQQGHAIGPGFVSRPNTRILNRSQCHGDSSVNHRPGHGPTRSVRGTGPHLVVRTVGPVFGPGGTVSAPLTPTGAGCRPRVRRESRH